MRLLVLLELGMLKEAQTGECRWERGRSVFLIFLSRFPLGNSTTETIASAGCAMTSVCMVLATYDIPINHRVANPMNFNNYLTENAGYVSGDLIVWDGPWSDCNI